MAHGSTVDNQGKISIVRRVLAGVYALGVDEILLMRDTHHLASRALEGMGAPSGSRAHVRLLEMPVTGDAGDSETAARLMRDAGARCIVVLGGDGTVRVVSHGAGDVPLLPISTGTNNVLPTFVEGTVAGMAAAALARGDVPADAATFRHNRLVLQLGDAAALTRRGEPDVPDALVDLAVLRGRHVGSRAVWDVARLRQAVVTRASPTSIGVSAILGAIRPLPPDGPWGLAATFRPDATRRVLAAVAPGLVVELGLEAIRDLHVGERVPLVADRPLIVALDGEREVALDAPGEAHALLLGDGPRIVDVERAMETLAREGRFIRHSGA